jgi:hypothetical protein
MRWYIPVHLYGQPSQIYRRKKNAKVRVGRSPIFKDRFFIIINVNKFLNWCPRGGSREEGAPGASPYPKIGKNIIFWRKIVIFHTKYPKYFRASFRNSRQTKNSQAFRSVRLYHFGYFSSEVIICVYLMSLMIERW